MSIACLINVAEHGHTQVEPLSNAATTIEIISDKLSLRDIDIKKVIEEVIRDKPEIILTAIQQLKLKDNNEVDNREEILLETEKSIQALNLPNLGNPDAKFDIVFVYSYNCKYCKKIYKVLEELVAKDSDIRFTLMPMALLNDESDEEVRYVLAANAVLKNDPSFKDLHDNMMSYYKENEQSSLDSICLHVGVSEQGCDLIREISNSQEILEKKLAINDLAAKMNVSGVPAFIIDHQMYTGSLSLEQMQGLIKKARQRMKEVLKLRGENPA